MVWPAMRVAGNTGCATENPVPDVWTELTVTPDEPEAERVTLWVEFPPRAIWPKLTAVLFALSCPAIGVAFGAWEELLAVVPVQPATNAEETNRTRTIELTLLVRRALLIFTSTPPKIEPADHKCVSELPRKADE